MLSAVNVMISYLYGAHMQRICLDITTDIHLVHASESNDVYIHKIFVINLQKNETVSQETNIIFFQLLKIKLHHDGLFFFLEETCIVCKLVLKFCIT